MWQVLSAIPYITHVREYGTNSTHTKKVLGNKFFPTKTLVMAICVNKKMQTEENMIFNLMIP